MILPSDLPCPIDELHYDMPPSGLPSSNLSRMGRIWTLPEASEKDILFLKQKYQISDTAARLASNRMRSLTESDEIFFPFLKKHMPDPSYLPDSEKAFEYAHQCLLEKRPLAVWGDYDVDGACSAALFVLYFRMLGMDITPYVPDRFQEGYGPNISGLEKLKAKGINDVFIVDCGTTAFKPLAAATASGMRIVIVDHHRASPIHPSVYAFVNPKRIDYTGPVILQELCAGGLVFLFLVGLNRYLRSHGYFENITEPDLMPLLDLVALSTICDMMPLRHINRAFVKQGLKIMRRRKNVGLTALIDASGVKEAPNPIHLGYTVGPRINAGGRIGDSSLGVRLLSCTNKLEAISLAQELNQLNQERQQIERQTLDEALIQARKQADRKYLFVFEENWHEGVLGIIASNLKENFYKPSFALTVKGPFLKGSARSVPGIDVGELIHIACEQELLVTGGGHPMAGGLTIERCKLEAFLAFVDEFFLHNKVDEPQPTLFVDMAITFEQLNDTAFFDTLDLLGPFGADYQQPRFLVSNIQLNHIVAFGYNHLRMNGMQSNGERHSIIFFRQAHTKIGLWLLSKPSHVADCVFTIRVDSRWGFRRPLLILEDIR